MALGNKYNNDNSKLLILKPRTQNRDKEKVEPYFEVSSKNEEGKWVEVAREPAVEGNLNRIEIKESEYEGQKLYNVSLYLKDSKANELYLVDLKLNMLTRGLLNSLVNLTAFDEVKLGLYTAKNGYPNIAVRQHGNLIKWKYSLDELPKIDTIIFKGKKMNDYTLVDEFFVSKIKEFSKLIPNSTSGQKEAKSKTDPTNIDSKIDKELDSDDENLF